MSEQLPLTEVFLKWLDVDLALCANETEQQLLLKGAVNVWNAAISSHPQQAQFALMQARMVLSPLLQKNYLKTKSPDQVIEAMINRKKEYFPEDNRTIKNLSVIEESGKPMIKIVSDRD